MDGFGVVWVVELVGGVMYIFLGGERGELLYKLNTGGEAERGGAYMYGFVILK